MTLRARIIIGLAIATLYGFLFWCLWGPDTPARPKDPHAYCDNTERPNPICDGERP